MLQSLHDAFNKVDDGIDYPSIEEKELSKIVRKWNELKTYCGM